MRFCYVVRVEETEDYLSTKRYPDWERDLCGIERLLRTPSLVENPQKPLLLLVSNDEEDELDVERLVNLFGLTGANFRRPFRAVLSDSKGNDGTLLEAIQWLTKTARSSHDEGTAMTGSDTEEESSILTSATAGTGATLASSSVGGHFVMDYEPTLLGGNPTLQRFEPIKKSTHCPFAHAAKLWGGKLPHRPAPGSRLLERGSLGRVCGRLQKRRSAGWVLFGDSRGAL
ncbi:hypothetical protein SEMRO_2096_G314310.1 [Seminavis robusta]|uniref:Uncharacterized protein n=1 Tax=Seminavis robusta TaxID=568900 RepID=A0A9N8EXP7_9STRA|nr:hypothetical protein SEMRO_2096_G314290.1 [Seminavis robusta]CAB9527874.1 hypothetical protein SEMRO_2096_G314310.1 [Seminavis robusta]|eukprot:Sro2096_g314290.1 n/a (229) ;mRNA; r:4239-4925